MGRALVPAVVAALALAGSALAGSPTGTVPGAMKGPLAPPDQRLTEAQVTRIFLADRKVADWLTHYPTRIRRTEASYEKRAWTVKVWAGAAGEVATGKVDDTSGSVTEAWTGPQVAWKMARGYDGAFGGKEINSAAVITANRVKVYSPAELLLRPIGTKPATVTKVPVSIGKAVEV